MPDEVLDGPCGPWPLDTSCCPGWPADPADWSPAQQAVAEIATEVLWRLTAGRYGLCEEVLRPCRKGCDEPLPSLAYGGGGLLRPVLDNGRWFNRPCGCGPSGCSCVPLCVIDLPGPVHEVVEVLQDGSVVDPAGYVLHRTATGGRLVRAGDECWPECQDLRLPDTEPDTLSVRYLRGLEVPAAGRRAVGQLACEIDKLCSGAAGGCSLPTGTKSVTREGVAYEIVPPGSWPETLQAHMPQVWAWVQLVNPGRVRQFGAVFSLDLPPAPVAARYRPGVPR
ncbi:hypothetical protein [Streptomyces sp. NPDC018352]|uniref:hypothetical protein n=1 Tax=Streptomyces sp. NPDC018352 TaxID=3157194 RepID=UPI00340C3642